MTEDTIGGDVVSFAQLFDQFEQCGFLCIGAGVLGCLSVGSATAYIANSYAICIISDRMGARLANITPSVNRAVTINYKVVANFRKISLTVPAVNVGNGEILTFWGGTAMDYDAIYHPSRHAQSRPSLCADNSISFKLVRRLEVFNRFIGQFPKNAVNSEVEPSL